MTDIVDRKTRSRYMAGIRGSNTKPERQLRSALHILGFRFRLHAKLPGRPDVVLPKYKAAIFVHGCFWHNHDCHLFRWPSTRRKFWKAKLSGNRERDTQTLGKLDASGWRCLTVWECALKGKHRLGLEKTASLAQRWIIKGRHGDEIRGDA